MNETKDDITDGPDDKQIDAIVIDNDKSTIYIIQGKYVQGGTIDASHCERCFLHDATPRSYSAPNDRKCKVAKKAFRSRAGIGRHYEISFELITTSTLTASALNDLQTFQNS